MSKYNSREVFEQLEKEMAMATMSDATASTFPDRDHYDDYDAYTEEVKHWQQTHTHRSVDGHAIVVGDRFWDNNLQVVEITRVATRSDKYSDTGEISTWHDTTRGMSDTLTGRMRQYGRLVKYYNGIDAARYEPGTSYNDVKRGNTVVSIEPRSSSGNDVK